MSRPGPNTFVVGAPKCGTTSVARYLSAHPRAYVPQVKEPHHFAVDLGLGDLTGYADRRAYVGLYDAVTAEHLVVADCSASSLVSRVAAERIHDFNPEARIVVLLRDPVELVVSLHHQLPVSGLPRVSDDLSHAVAFAERHFGEPLDGLGQRVGTRYLDFAAYASQLRRYMDRFPREQVTVIIFDDLRADTAATWEHLQDRLGLPRAEVPLGRENARKHVHRPWVQRWIVNPPARVRRVGRSVVPSRIRHGVRRAVWRHNVDAMAAEPVPSEVAARIRRRLRPEIEALEQLLDRDLVSWRGVSG